MIESIPTNVSSAFDILNEQVEAEINFVNGADLLKADPRVASGK